MFKNQEEIKEIETIIGPSVQVEGDFIAAGDVVVEGTVSGKITTERNLKIGSNAKIYANITAASALIAGEVQGNIKVKDSLELTSTAKVFGDVKTKIITITAGAVFHGRCQAGDEKKSKFEKIGQRLGLNEKKIDQPEELVSLDEKVK